MTKIKILLTELRAECSSIAYWHAINKKYFRPLGVTQCYYLTTAYRKIALGNINQTLILSFLLYLEVLYLPVFGFNMFSNTTERRSLTTITEAFALKQLVSESTQELTRIKLQMSRTKYSRINQRFAVNMAAGFLKYQPLILFADH